MSQPQFSEEELRQLEAEMERITVDDVLIQTTVTLLNLAARKAGLGAPPGEGGGGGTPAGEPASPEKPQGPGPAQSTGRLWVPGQ